MNRKLVGNRIERNHSREAAAENKRPGVGSFMIKLVLLAVLAVFLFAVYKLNDAPDVSMNAIADRMSARTDLSGFQKCDERDLKQFIGLEPSQYDSFFYYRGKEALSVDEVLVIKMPDKADVDVARDAAEARVAAQIKAFESYGPEQVKRLKNSVITSQGRYLFYCVAKSPLDYEEVFKDVI